MKKNEVNIIPFRSAFVLFKEKGIDAVKYEFPECVPFVEAHKELSIEEVTSLLIRKLDSLQGDDVLPTA